MCNLWQNLQIFEGNQYLVEVEQALTKIFKIVEGSQYLVEVILMPKSMTQEEHVGLFSCN